MNIISRRCASKSGLKQYFTGKPCKHGHISNRTVIDGTCVVCKRRLALDYHSRNYHKNKPNILIYQKLHYKEHCEHKKQQQKDWWHNKRTEHTKENRNVYLKKYNKSERGYAIKRTADAFRRAQKLKATPSWYTQEELQIREMYALCKKITKDSGIQHHVDHIVPLINKYVCGLHCRANLQIITAKDNRTKGNQLKEELLE